ncbi:hypothetical protein DPF_0653 [Desulfoplanes formicivorans]|uniref:Uncharacterized protein n=1 Tax=Desulfoplanes formicivorans TaxID=1592317 RepID=A0A194AGQ1_9BACT|nr:hypothetical protein DPF_0653 [Desulfoplanes formicivorans]
MDGVSGQTFYDKKGWESLKASRRGWQSMAGSGSAPYEDRRI